MSGNVLFCVAVALWPMGMAAGFLALRRPGDPRSLALAIVSVSVLAGSCALALATLYRKPGPLDGWPWFPPM